MPIDIVNDDIQTALQKLKAKENSLLKLESISKIGGWEVDLATKESIWSEQTFLMYGLDKDTTKPNLELFLSMLSEEDREKALKGIAKGVETGEVETFQCQITRADGEVRDILINGQVVFDEKNIPIKILGSSQDITQYLNSIRETQELSELIEYSSNEIYIKLNY